MISKYRADKLRKVIEEYANAVAHKDYMDDRGFGPAVNEAYKRLEDAKAVLDAAIAKITTN